MAAMLLAAGGVVRAELDRNGNGFNDAWELLYAAGGLAPGGDEDGDGASNAEESAAGTDPRVASSAPVLRLGLVADPVMLPFAWGSSIGKAYALLASTNLAAGPWSTNWSGAGTGVEMVSALPVAGAAGFHRLAITDVDRDGDGLTDYEETLLRFNPAVTNTDRFPQSDYARVTNGLSKASTVTLAVLDPRLSEGWPEPGLVAVRRAGGLAPLQVAISFSGSADFGVDYACAVTSSIVVPLGVREVWIELVPLADAVAEAAESITVTALAGAGYSVLSASNTAALTLENAGAGSGPSVKEAARFLLQAAFGPDQDSSGDADDIPENVEEVMGLGFAGWLDDQATRPVGLIEPMTAWVSANSQSLQLYTDPKVTAWWGRAMGAPKLTPDSTTNQLPDPLRQRVAFALSEVLVISDRPEALGVQQVGMANYYDVLVRHALGNYGELLCEVAMHPCMGTYLSHIGNRKADPSENIFPDENFAREIMQLFTIGLWELHPDGTRRLDEQGQPIPSYDNGDITELARVFTGLGMGGTNNNFFSVYPANFDVPMKMWDAEHDCEAKTLLGGLVLPARVASPGSTGSAGRADVAAAISNLFHHANTGPFVGRQLIQRLVTSNPSTSYVARVAAVFADNGSGERGDLQAVVRAILLDPEAREAAPLQSPTWGKLREPFLRVVNFARAFNASSPSGIYALDSFNLDHAQMPLNSPSVFNFFLPSHSPPGPLTAQGLVAPEFQIVNASTAISAPNYFWDSVWGGLNRWGVANPSYNVTLNLEQELAMVVPADQTDDDMPAAAPYDPDPLLRRLDLALTGGTLSPVQFQIIREALARVPRPSWQWHREYLRMAIYLVVTSPEFCVQR
jgi:uncharacterized protein (DUF1800 family)